MKVFGIGFHKTGTSSLGRALEQLGYNVCGNFIHNETNLGDTLHQRAYDMAERYDAFQDFPWPLLYRELDKRYPGSRFILTTRNTDAWVRSVLKHVGAKDGGKGSPMFERVYGISDPVGQEETLIARYERHNTDVLKYFEGRPSDLLVLDVSQKSPWEVLCEFLDEDVPNAPFPHVNRGDRLSRLGRRFKRFAKRGLRKLLGGSFIGGR